MKICLDGICDNINTLDDAGNFGSVKTNVSYVNIYSLVKIYSSTYTMQDETITDGKIISSSERIFNAI